MQEQVKQLTDNNSTPVLEFVLWFDFRNHFLPNLSLLKNPVPFEKTIRNEWMNTEFIFVGCANYNSTEINETIASQIIEWREDWDEHVRFISGSVKLQDTVVRTCLNISLVVLVIHTNYYKVALISLAITLLHSGHWVSLTPAKTVHRNLFSSAFL